MESKFGEYITKQYGLLKEILYHLEPRDLSNAKLVCRDWNRTVESIIEKNPIFRSQRINRPFKGFTALPSPILPSLVLYQHLSKPHLSYCELCKKRYFCCPCELSGSETLFVSLDVKLINPVPSDLDKTVSYTFWHHYSALLLTSSPKIEVSVHCIESTELLKKPITDELVTLCTGGEDPIKCILVLSKATTRSYKGQWISKLLNEIVLRQGMTFAVGGGDIENMLCKKGNDFRFSNWRKPQIVFITFRGENVSAVSDIISTLDMNQLERSMVQLKEKAGPVLKGSTQIAFISQCVARIGHHVEEVESEAFRKAFPTITQFGFRAFGEYGIKSCNSGKTEQKDSGKRMLYTFNHSHTTSFVILTFSKV